MYGVRTRSGMRGLGWFDIGNPAACGFTDLGVTKGICWCTSVPEAVCDAVMGKGSYAAAIAAQSPDVAYPKMPLPPAPKPVTDYGVSPTVPPTVEEAQAAISASLAAQKQAQNQQLSDYFNQVAGNLKQLGDDSKTPGGIGTTALIALGLVAGIGLLALTGRRR